MPGPVPSIHVWVSSQYGPLVACPSLKLCVTDIFAGSFATWTQFSGNYRGMARPRTSPQPEVPGLAARRIAADILEGVLRRGIALDEFFSCTDEHTALPAL